MLTMHLLYKYKNGFHVPKLSLNSHYKKWYRKVYSVLETFLLSDFIFFHHVDAFGSWCVYNGSLIWKILSAIRISSRPCAVLIIKSMETWLISYLRVPPSPLVVYWLHNWKAGQQDQWDSSGVGSSHQNCQRHWWLSCAPSHDHRLTSQYQRRPIPHQCQVRQ